MLRLTKRDLRLLAKLAAGRWLTTSQVAALIFPGKDPSIARRRLAALARAGYIRSTRTTRTAEVFHAVGLGGKATLLAEGLPFEFEKALPAELEHLKGINDLRVAVETGPMPVGYFYAAWELAAFPHFRRLIPDAAFAVGGARKLRCVVEYDRASEPRKVFRHKALSYLDGLTTYPWDVVLIVAETHARLESLMRNLKTADLPSRRFLAGAMLEIRAKGIFEDVFVDSASPGPRLSLASLASSRSSESASASADVSSLHAP